VADGDVGVVVKGAYGTITIHADGSYTYELDNNKRAVKALNDGEKLVDTFSYTLTDADGDKSTTTVKITINGKTDAPLVLASVEDGGPVNGKFAYTGLDALTPYAVGQQPGHGTVTIDASGNWVYTPHADYNGQDSFVVAIKDASGKTTTEVITINLAPEQDAFDDNASAKSTTPLVIDVLANDGFEGVGTRVTHINGTAISAGGAVVAVNHGTVTLGVDGKLVFVAEIGYEGKTNFTYTATSAQGTPETATVNVTVAPSITAREDSIEIHESAGGKSDVVLIIDKSASMLDKVTLADGTSTTRFALLKDAVKALFDSGSVNSVRLYTFDGNGFLLNSAESGGWYTDLNAAMARINAVTPDGATAYSNGLNTVQRTYTAPPPGGSSLISIFLTDGNPDPLTHVIDPVREAAWIDFLTQKGFDASYAAGIGPEVTNRDALEPVAWTPGETVGSITDGTKEPNIVMVEDDRNQLTQTLLDWVFKGKVAEGNATANDDAGAAGWDASGWKIASIKFLDGSGVEQTHNFTDAKSSITIDVYTSTGLLIGKLKIAGDGSYTFTGLDNFDTAQDVSAVLYYTARDADGATVSTTLKLTVKNNEFTAVEDSGPVIGKLTHTSLDATAPYSIGKQPLFGSVTVDASGNWIYTPHADYSGKDTFVILVKDAHGTISKEVIGINLTAEQDAFDDTAVANGATVIDVLANDRFEGLAVKITHIDGKAITAGGAAVTVANGKVTLGTDGKLTFVANAGYEGQAQFSYTAKSAQGTPETAVVSVEVVAGPRPKGDAAEVHESGGSQAKSDVLLMIDISSGMKTLVNGVSRLDTLKASIKALFDSGDVNSVRLYSFAGTAASLDSGKDGGWFSNLDEAMAAINALQAATTATISYNSVLNLVGAQNAFQAPPPGGSSLVSMFITNGDSSTVVSESTWTQFLESHHFDASYAVSVGAITGSTNLEAIAWGAGEAVGTYTSNATDPRVSMLGTSWNLALLTQKLQSQVNPGEVLYGDLTANDQSGASGWAAWRVTAIKYLDNTGVLKTFSFTSAASTTTVDVYTSTGQLLGKLKVSGDGLYTFIGVENLDVLQDLSTVVQYTVRNAANLRADSTLTLTVKDSSGFAGAALDDAAEHVVVHSAQDEAAPAGMLLPAHHEPASTSTVSAAAEQEVAGHEVRGTPGNDLLIGTDGGDFFIWSHGDEGTVLAPAKDVVVGFGMGADGQGSHDQLVLDDLLQGEELVTDLSVYLHVEKSSNGRDTVIKVSSDGKLNADGSNFNQEIILKGVDLVGEAQTSTTAEQNALIQQLLNQGKVTMNGH
jgi:VCBS repeat-containing protein